MSPDCRCGEPASGRMPAVIEHRRVHHAAHNWRGVPLWDLSEWTVEATKEAGPPQIDRVEYAHGFIRDGRQFSVWARKEAAHPDACDRCPKPRVVPGAVGATEDALP